MVVADYWKTTAVAEGCTDPQIIVSNSFWYYDFLWIGTTYLETKSAKEILKVLQRNSH